jgi:hypothetical protein
VVTGGSGETGGTGENCGTGETGEAAGGTFTCTWATLAPQAPQNADVSCKGVPQVPQNLATMDAPAPALGVRVRLGDA